MRYRTFTTEKEAIDFLSSAKREGYKGYILKMRQDWYEVRTWI